MTKFEYAHTFTARWEGGLSNHPNDRGGVTAYGVSLEFLRDFAKKEAGLKLLYKLALPLPVSASTVRKMTADKAADIFHMEFWTGLDDFEERVACFAYDASVNHGKSRAFRFLQAAANDMGASLAVDGICGPLTRKALTSIHNPADLCRRALAQRASFYYTIVNKDPSQKCFLKGWLNRNNALKKYLGLE